MNATKSSKIPDLFSHAKTQVDLPGFLASHGWRAVPGKDTVRYRFLAGPAGERILVNLAAGSGHWVWRDTTDAARRGTIVDACEQLLGFSRKQTYGELRRAIQNPPASLPLARGGSIGATVSTTFNPPTRPPRQLAPLSEQAIAYLTGKRCLDPAIVAAFSHRLRSNAHGHLVAPHNGDGDGEERGEGWKSFVGSRTDGAGRGRSVWHAQARGGETPATILVAESVIAALSAWQELDEAKKASTLLVSTAGSLSESGKAKLVHLVRQAQHERQRVGSRGKIVLVDASDVGEVSTQAREDALYALSAYLGAGYERLSPPMGKDWNETVINSWKIAQAQSEREQDHELQRNPYLDSTEEEQEDEQHGHGSPGGHGRGR